MPDEDLTNEHEPTIEQSGLDAVLAEYLHAVEAGEKPNREELLAKHPELADDLREFFSNHDQMDQLARPIGSPVPPHDQSTLIRPESEKIGLTLGPYTLIQKLGEGGMGEVWVAKQSEPVKRKVALKLIKGGCNTRDVLTRFEQERQALAMMDHPNIAKVFDGGVVGQASSLSSDSRQAGSLPHSGQPYFVMELVNGLPLTKYCDEAKLTPRQRMELFVPICQAVQHAHQKGIVHRDLKPSNILVTIYDGQPVPKVIDFGVAKATGGKLTDESMSTQFGAVVGTLEYMSPEQAGFSGQDIDTRADIYSLGVILYELLTGLRPFDGQRLRKAALTELIRIIQEEEPSKPSTRLSSDASLPSLAALRQTEPKRLTALLRGELDWVVMKCLEKPRDRRYETANALSRDIQRYLADEPVEARPPSANYRFHKFLRRHKGPVLAASLVMLALIGGIIGTTWGLMREAKQRKLAETNEGKANDAAKKERIAKEEERIAKDKAVATAIEERKQRDRADQNTKLARRHLYVAQMNLAQNAWEATRVGAVLDLLDRHCPHRDDEDLRDFEWFYWHRLCHRDLHTLKGHTGAVNCVAFSPDGKRIASASSDETVKLWNAATGQEIATLIGHTDGVSSVVFSPDGARIASASWDGTVKLWDAATGQETATLIVNDLNSVAFSPDGARIATASHDQTVKLWDVATAQETVTLTGHTDAVLCVAFSPDGALIASASYDQTVKLWDTSTGQETMTLQGHRGALSCVTFSRAGTRIASASYDRTVKVWDVATGQEIATLKGHTRAVISVAFSLDDARIATSSWDETVKLWSAGTGQVTATLKGHTREVNSVAFSPDGARIASASDDRTVKFWPVGTDQETATLKGQTRDIQGLALGATDARITLASYDNRDKTVKLRDAATGQEIATLKGHADRVNCVAFSPDGKRIASGSYDRMVKLWDAATGQEIATIGHTAAVRSVVFSPDGSRIASACWDGVKLWDAATGQATATLIGHKNNVDSVAFSPDGARIASGQDRTVKLWNAATGQETATLKGHTGAVNRVTFSPDGKRIASASSDETVRLWDAATGQETATLRGHTRYVISIAFNPDGTRIASASSDETVKLWDPVTGQEVLTLKGHSGVNCVAFSLDGARLVTASYDQTVKLWDAPRVGIR